MGVDLQHLAGQALASDEVQWVLADAISEWASPEQVLEESLGTVFQVELRADVLVDQQLQVEVGVLVKVQAPFK